VYICADETDVFRFSFRCRLRSAVVNEERSSVYSVAFGPYQERDGIGDVFMAANPL
jgi:hypothetical protein